MRRTWKRTLGAYLLALCLCLSLLPTAALAADDAVGGGGNPFTPPGSDQSGGGMLDPTDDPTTPEQGVSYIEYTLDETNGLTGEEKKTDSNYTTVTADDTAWGTATDATTWYVATGTVTIPSRVTVSGTVNLILEDGCTLTVHGGIWVAEGSTLNIYGQTGSDGKLIATAAVGSGNAGIGSNAGWTSCGAITIHGGNVTATGGSTASGRGGAGIGGGAAVNNGTGGNGGNVTVYGGTVTAGGNNGEGIGSGFPTNSNPGQFYTTGAGNAVIFASSICDQSGKANWKGVIFEDKNGWVYSNTVTPTEGFTIPQEYKLTIPAGSTLDVRNVTAANLGTIVIEEHGNLAGTFSGSGTIQDNRPGLDVSGGALGEDYTYGNGVLTILTDTPLTLSMAEGVTSTNNRIVVPANDAGTARLTLDQVTITVLGESLLDVQRGLDLTLVGENRLTNKIPAGSGGSITPMAFRSRTAH